MNRLLYGQHSPHTMSDVGSRPGGAASAPSPHVSLDGLRVWAALLHVHAAVVSALEEELRSCNGLELSAFEVLLRLDQATDRLRMQDLADFALLSKSGLTRLVDRMQEAGLVRRASCPTDRRGTFAVITDDGRRALAEARPCVVAALERHFTAHLSEVESAALLTAFTRVLHAHGRRAGLGACACG